MENNTLQILDYLLCSGEVGATIEEIADEFQLSQNTVRTVTNKLMKHDFNCLEFTKTYFNVPQKNRKGGNRVIIIKGESKLK